jgi:YVTN family beta-propeller protein
MHMRRLMRLVSGIGVCLACLTVVAAASGSQPLPRSGTVVATVRVPAGKQGTGGFALGEKAVWVMSVAAARLSRIDPQRNAVVARVKVDDGGGATVGNGAVWLSHPSDNTVLRIDPKSNAVTATIAVGQKPEGVASSPGAIWVANRGALAQQKLVPPSLSRIDPATNQVVATIQLGPDRACCSDHISVAVGAGAVWVAVPNLSGVVRVDPATNKVVATIKMKGPCGFLTATDQAVWVAGAHCTPAIARLDPRTNRRVTTTTGTRAPIALAVGFGSLWVTDLDPKAIVRVNLRSGRIVSRLVVGGFPVRLVVGYGSVWIQDDTGRVLRIKPTRAPS